MLEVPTERWLVAKHFGAAATQKGALKSPFLCTAFGLMRNPFDGFSSRRQNGIHFVGLLIRRILMRAFCNTRIFKSLPPDVLKFKHKD